MRANMKNDESKPVKIPQLTADPRFSRANAVRTQTDAQFRAHSHVSAPQPTKRRYSTEKDDQARCYQPGNTSPNRVISPHVPQRPGDQRTLPACVRPQTSAAKPMKGIPFFQRYWVSYDPSPDANQFLDRVETQADHGLEVGVVVLDAIESQRYFGVPMARRGVQPIWLRVVNNSDVSYRLHVISIDPDYFSPLEAAAINRFSIGKRLASFGLLIWFFLPLLLIAPLRIWAVHKANRRMEEVFKRSAIPLRAIDPGKHAEGFVFTPLDVGSKRIQLRLMGPDQVKEFSFTISIPGLDADHRRTLDQHAWRTEEIVDCEVPDLISRLAQAPRATTNAHKTREGDPVNLVIVGEFETILSAFASRWDETEILSLKSCWRTACSFLLGQEYRYSPVSPLYLFDRHQDFALQRVRESIHERLHLRLWWMPLRFRGLPVWIGQVSRDIGVRMTWRTWNLTTHRIDPDVDEARDYVVQDLLEAQRVEAAAYVDGAGACNCDSPRRNLTGDPYFTDGKRAAVLLSPTRMPPRFLAWA